MNGAFDIGKLLLTGIFLPICFSNGLTCKGVYDIYCPDTGQCESYLLTSCRHNCPMGKVSCEGGNKCYTKRQRCDNIRYCSDGVDEKYCCQSYNYECDDGDTCYSDSDICDHYRTCRDGQDEKNCASQCSSYTCDNGKKCYTYGDRCDDTWDCSDGSDEEDCHVSDDDGGLGLGTSTGTIIIAVIAVIAFSIIVLCFKKAAQSVNNESTGPPGAVAYHSAANYRQTGNFQVTHNSNNSAENRSNSNTLPTYSVDIGENGTSNSNSGAFLSSHRYNNGSTTQLSNTDYPGVPPSAPVIEPSASGRGPNSSLPYPAAAAAVPYNYPVFPPPPSAGDLQPSPASAPPPSYELLFPEVKTVT